MVVMWALVILLVRMALNEIANVALSRNEDLPSFGFDSGLVIVHDAAIAGGSMIVEPLSTFCGLQVTSSMISSVLIQ